MEEIKVESELKLCEAKIDNLGIQLDKIQSHSSDILFFSLQWRDLQEYLKTAQGKVEKRFRELALKETELQDKSFALEERAKVVEAAEAEMADLEMKTGGFRMEIEEKRKDLTLVQDNVKECEKLLETRTSELVSKERELVVLSLDLDLREEMVRSLNNDMKETCQQMESKAKELEGIQRLIEERNAHFESINNLIEEHNEELALKEKRQDEMRDAIRKLSFEIDSVEKTLERAKLFVEQLSEKQHSMEDKLDSTERSLEKCSAKYDSKKKELRSVKNTYKVYVQNLDIKENELKSLQSILTQRTKQVEEEEMNMQHLDNSVQELIRQLKLKQEEVCAINQSVKECSGELEAKRKHHDQVQSSIIKLTAELNAKEIELNSVKKKIQDRWEDFQSKEEKQVRLKASLMEREQGLELKEKKLAALEEKIELKEKELDSREEKMDKRDQLLKSSKKNLEECVNDHELVQDANVSDDQTLQLILRGHLKKCPQLHLDISRSLKASSDPAKLVLETIQGLYSAHQGTAVTNLDPNSVRRSSIYLLECLMDILAYTFDADKVQNLFDVVFLRKYAPSLCEALGVSALAPVNNVLSLEDKPEQQPPEVPISNSNDSCSRDVQENIASSPLANEDALRDFEGSAFFSPNEVSTNLPMLKDPGRFVLTSVEDALTGAHQRGELSLADPILTTLVPLLEELPRVVSSPDPDLQSDATKVAHRWSIMMGTSAQKSHLEAWAFLQFIVAYGLVKRTNQDETLKFASNVAHFKQAPKLFQSLGLSSAIPNFVKLLLNNALYFPAIRFILFFNLKNNFSPLVFLKEEIINLRRSAKEKRSFESQAEVRDAAKLRDIIELIEDFKLEIDLPVDLITKFMVPREIKNQKQSVVSSSVPLQSPQILPSFHMQDSHTVFHSSYNATNCSNPSLPTSFGAAPNPQVLDVETYQAAGSTALQGQSSHLAGSKRPRVDPVGPRPAIRPCLFPQSGNGRF
ncbi:hypothetical protein EUTSA_v10003597mg [Eutrema salsugineum]|uniref:FRIGIDA-like protein n=1 Tax=Eutrema salsugineum TaxID=72664 RepID=V4MLF0_EUTSA|nr:hypothetical protein EUTSA_v10003597mg [Eutrema salsugineum]